MSVLEALARLGGSTRACNVYAASAAEIPAARQRARELFGSTLGNGVVKQLEEQSVVGLLAVHAALEMNPVEPGFWHDWAVVGACQRPGRRLMAQCLAQYQVTGATAVSPYVVPHGSLHSLSGIISQVLGAHGPNLGAGGTPGDEPAALLAATAMLDLGVPGVWVVWSGWRDEPTLASTRATAECRAAALALTRTSAIPHAPPLSMPISLDSLMETLRLAKTHSEAA